MVENRAVAREGGLDLAGEIIVLLRRREPLLAFCGILVGLPPRDVKKMADEFGRLPHVEIGNRIGESAFKPDHRLEERRTEAEQRGKS